MELQLNYQARTRDHYLRLLLPEFTPIPKVEEVCVYIDEKSRTQFLCGCPVGDFKEIQFWLTNLKHYF